MRSLVVWCPHWPVTAAGAGAGTASAVVHANRVVAVSPAARADGVVPGLRRREAQARCPALAVLERDEAGEARAFEAVVAALEELTPVVEVVHPGVCAFPTRGPSRYFGGDAALARRALRLARAALADDPGGGWPTVGVADGTFAATLAARAAVEGDGGDGGCVVVPRGQAAAFLAPFPVAMLDRSELADLLVRLGLPTLGHLAALDTGDVVGRFGADGALAHRLARGLDERPPAARRPPSDLAVSAEVDPPAERVDTAAFVAKALADELHERLSSAGLACTRVLIEAETEHGERLARQWRHEGVLGPAAVAERVRWQLDGWLTGAGGAQRPTAGITRLCLVPDEVVADRGRQLGFWGGQTRADERAARALARVQALVGPGSVTVPQRRGGRGPADQVDLLAVEALDLTAPRGGGPEPGGPPGAAPWPGRLPSPSPGTVHRMAVAAEVTGPGGERVGVSGRGLVTAPPVELRVGDARAVPVVAWGGPWPVDERWWDTATRRRRARFQVQTADGCARLLSLEGGQWSVEATYD